MSEKEMRDFALRGENSNEIGVFTGKSPRQAALKAANRGHTDIKLREQCSFIVRIHLRLLSTVNRLKIIVRRKIFEPSIAERISSSGRCQKTDKDYCENDNKPCHWAFLCSIFSIFY